MRQFENLSVAIIAGGKSRRFGEPKALAKFGERTLFEHALRLAEKISSQVMAITGESTIQFSPQITSFPDVIPSCGPLGGVYTALFHAPTDWIATLPCDMPLLTASVYQEMYRRMEDERPIAAVSHKGLEPLVAIWPRSALPVVQEHLYSFRLKLRDVFHSLGGIEVHFSQIFSPYDPAIFYNVNTKQDLENLFKINEQRESLLV